MRTATASSAPAVAAAALRKPDFREGDWICQFCRNHNFERRRDRCHDCGQARPDAPALDGKSTATGRKLPVAVSLNV